MNETITLQIEDLTREGDGVGRLPDGKAVFVSGALPRETVKARVMEEKKTYAKAALLEVIEPSKDRRVPLCPYAADCGGCGLSHLSYDAALRQKEKWVFDALTRIGGIEIRKGEEAGEGDGRSAEFLPILGMEEPLRYRNKAELAIGPGGEAGYRARKSNRIVDCETCLLQATSTERAARALRTYLRETGYRLFKRMIVRTASDGSVMVVFETDVKSLKTLAIPRLQMLADLLTEAIEEDTFAFRSLALTNGKETVTLAGAPVIREEASGLLWEISPLSFFQVNTRQMERLYETVRAFLTLAAEGERKKERPVILDLYCGTGTIGLSLADLADHVLGVESVRSAVIDANRNAVINGICNAEFLCGKAEDVLPKMFETSPLGGDDYRPSLVFPSGFTAPADVVILDPPRTGCDPRLLDAAVLAGPSQIVYVSCDPATLSRDLKHLASNGYAPRRIRPVDMFPYTNHVEAVVQLVRDDL